MKRPNILFVFSECSLNSWHQPYSHLRPPALCIYACVRRDEGTRGRGDGRTKGRGSEGTRGREDEGTRGRGDEGARTYLSGHKRCVTDRREVILLWPMAISHLRPTAPLSRGSKLHRSLNSEALKQSLRDA